MLKTIKNIILDLLTPQDLHQSFEMGGVEVWTKGTVKTGRVGEAVGMLIGKLAKRTMN